MNNFRHKIFIFFIPFVVLSFTCIYILIIDPAQFIFTKYKNTYDNKDGLSRFIPKQVIDSYDFQGIIIGSSMLAQSNASEIKNAKYINISFSGSSLDERIPIIQYAIKNKNIKYVITSFDGFWNSPYPYEFKYYYDSSNIINGVVAIAKILNLYINNYKPYKCFYAFKYNEECNGYLNDYYLTSYKFDISKEHGKLEEIYSNYQITGIPQYSDFDSIEKLYNIIQENKNINFIIIDPPRSSLWFKKTNIKQYEKKLKLIANKLISYENVIFYGFNNENFTNNILNYYPDLEHYLPTINAYINKAINDGKNIVTKENLEEYFDNFIKKVENYDIKAYKEALRLDIRE